MFQTNEIQLKGDNKEKWRQFCEYYKETMDDYNFGAMLRIKADGIYNEANTIITPKVFSYLMFLVKKSEFYVSLENG